MYLFNDNFLGFEHRFVYELRPEDLPVAYSCESKDGEKVSEHDADYKEKLANLTYKIGTNLNAMTEEVAFQRLSSAVDPLRVEKDASGKYTGMKCADGTEAKVAYLRDRVDVLLLQVLLKKLYTKYPKVKDLNPGTLDGKWGKNTKSALEIFQVAAGIRRDGEFGPETLVALKETFEGKKDLNFAKVNRAKVVEDDQLLPLAPVFRPGATSISSGASAVEEEGVSSLEYEVRETITPAYSYEIDGNKLTAYSNVSPDRPGMYEIVAPKGFIFAIAKDPEGKECVLVTDNEGREGYFELDPGFSFLAINWGAVAGKNPRDSVWSKYEPKVSRSKKNIIEIVSLEK